MNDGQPATLADLATISGIQHLKERGIVAADLQIRPEVATSLVTDPWYGVRLILAHNPHTPMACLDALAQDHDRDVRCAVAGNQWASSQALALMIEDEDEEVRYCIARRAHPPVSVLIKLAADPVDKVRDAARCHRDLPDYVRSILILGGPHA